MPDTNREAFSSGFLEHISCDDIPRGSRLSLNPLSEDRIQSTQAERRIMVQMRLYQCFAPALQEVEDLIAGASMTAEASDKSRRCLDQAKNWWGGANRKYVNGVIRVLQSAQPRTYGLGDSTYPWTYPAHGIRSMTRALSFAFVDLPRDRMSAETAGFFTKKRGREGKSGTGGELVRSGQTFFDAPISAEQTQIIDQMDQLHDQAALANLCRKHTGQWCPGGRPASELVSDYDVKSLQSVRDLGMPKIAPFARGMHRELSYEESCVLFQRITRAHHIWTDGVKNGHRPEAFRQAWIGMMAHALLHAELRTGKPIPKVERLLQEILNHVYASVPGVVVGRDGSITCPLP